MDEQEKVRFKQLLSEQFHDNLKDLNDALEKHIKSIIYKKQFNKIMYEKHKHSDEFIQKKYNMINDITKKIRKYYWLNGSKNTIMIMSLKNR